MELSILQTFVDVVKQGSFAAVARERNVDPSSVSRAIAGLEPTFISPTGEVYPKSEFNQDEMEN